ncbi:hypothetical protein ABIC83_003064 [Roseateles asaccharophilus]|uniref:hypothetical protein n=1 Tax=Roseateles asaccharophilus TaxID=582607 RepID=UPI003838F936
MSTAAPITFNDGANCDPSCPHLRSEPLPSLRGTCARDEKPLNFHDWYLAHCGGQVANPDTQGAAAPQPL